MNREAGRKFVTAGVVLAVVGVVFTVFSADFLVGLGVGPNQAGLLGIVGILSKILMFFGLPLAAGLITVGLALRVPMSGEQPRNHGE